MDTAEYQRILDEHNERYGAYCFAQVVSEAGDDWIPTTDLATRPEIVIDAIQRLAGSYESDDLRVASSFFLKTYANHVTGLGISLLQRNGVVPDVRPETTFVRIGADGQIAGLGLTQQPIQVAADNSAASVDVLCPLLVRQWAEDVFPTMLDGLRVSLKMGRRAMLGTVTDTIVGIVMIMLNQDLPAERLGALSQQFVDHPYFDTGSGVDWVSEDGRTLPVFRRGVCCLAYRLDQYGYCDTCPVIADKARAARVAEKLDVGPLT